jgi:hypothetical protein
MAGAARQEDTMNFETISLLLSWMELGALLAILFRLGHTFELIANTQRELRRAIHHLGERRGAEPDAGWSARIGGLSPETWTLPPAPIRRSGAEAVAD